LFIIATWVSKAKLAADNTYLSLGL